ncbi:MAG: aminotransferase class I/II-fold pyridoxal phosphate-dependent enzyme [Rectinema sp.]|jgi:aspartate/methionine/tyrosine aminotransferase|uniref:Aminotransferase class I and II n=1 Tax=uncultured spirochete TaxID=156406 RepID=A0A3P3XUS0_9SPIR|nr:Aminotransferase class I and II [uncultured spirochete]
MPLQISDLSDAVLHTHYAVRGPIVARAQELEDHGKEIIYCNIGNPQALGQKPLSYVRNVLAACERPELLKVANHAFLDDVREKARYILEQSRYGIGAYSESKGLRFVRAAISEFIAARDSHDGVAQASNPEHVYLTDGASKGVQTALRLLIASGNDGILIPIPQYPLYSATITLYGGRQIGYYLDEESGWGLNEQLLEDAMRRAMKEGIRARAIVVINPGNPTGSVLSEDDMRMVIHFAKRHNLAILADEVYQENIYKPGLKFISFAHLMSKIEEREVSLFSFHSTSKGFFGECGQRGGYMEVRNVPEEVIAQITKLQSVALCANLPGQVLTYLMVSPPVAGEPSYRLFDEERNAILSELGKRAKMMEEGLNRIPGIHCQPIDGAMYAYPSLSLPAGRTDEEYCMTLLEATGVCVVPGSGFGQKPGTAHFRTTILPPTSQIEHVIDAIAAFHLQWR